MAWEDKIKGQRAARELFQLLSHTEVSASGFSRWVNNGTIPSEKWGNRYWFKREDIVKLAQQGLEWE